MATIAQESGHWYDMEGKPCYTIVGANGVERPTTLRDARKLKLYPSVTEILKIQAKPALQNWLIQQAVDAVLTLPRDEHETLEQFKVRALEDAKVQSEKARERGTALHGAIELYLQGKMFDLQFEPHINAVKAALSDIGIDLHDGESERSFARDGYGGKVDWHSRNQKAVIDFKSKDRIVEGQRYGYDDQALQLHAYAYGLDMDTDSRLINVFIGVEDAKVQIVQWPWERRYLGWYMSLLTAWKYSKSYYQYGE